MGLLDNRKNQTPRQSMESLVKYARKQDSALNSFKMRNARVGVLLNYTFFGAIGTYLIYQFIWGYWPSIFPRSLVSAQTQGVVSKKREYFTPEIFLKDSQRWSKDLVLRETQAIKQRKSQH